MSVTDLSSPDQTIALACLKFIVDDKLLDDDELYSRISLHRSELLEISLRWPALSDAIASSLDYLALNNSFNEVCYGLDISIEDWNRYFPVSPKIVEEVYQRWLIS